MQTEPGERSSGAELAARAVCLLLELFACSYGETNDTPRGFSGKKSHMQQHSPLATYGKRLQARA